jgi:hypothetical protein
VSIKKKKKKKKRKEEKGTPRGECSINSEMFYQGGKVRFEVFYQGGKLDPR